MPHVKLTKSAIDKIPVREGAYFDPDQPAFGLQVGNAKKSFFVRRDPDAEDDDFSVGG